jgi:hypothetical protein
MLIVQINLSNRRGIFITISTKDKRKGGKKNSEIRS